CFGDEHLALMVTVDGHNTISHKSTGNDGSWRQAHAPSVSLAGPNTGRSRRLLSLAVGNGRKSMGYRVRWAPGVTSLLRMRRSRAVKPRRGSGNRNGAEEGCRMHTARSKLRVRVERMCSS